MGSEAGSSSASSSRIIPAMFQVFSDGEAPDAPSNSFPMRGERAGREAGAIWQAEWQAGAVLWKLSHAHTHQLLVMGRLRVAPACPPSDLFKVGSWTGCHCSCQRLLYQWLGTCSWHPPETSVIVVCRSGVWWCLQNHVFRPGFLCNWGNSISYGSPPQLRASPLLWP